MMFKIVMNVFGFQKPFIIYAKEEDLTDVVHRINCAWIEDDILLGNLLSFTIE